MLTYEDRINYQNIIISYQKEGLTITDIIFKNIIDKPIKLIFKEIKLSIINLIKNIKSINQS